MNTTVSTLLSLLRMSLDPGKVEDDCNAPDSGSLVHLAYHQEVAALICDPVQLLYESGCDVLDDKQAKLRLFRQKLIQEKYYEANLKTMHRLSDLFESDDIVMYVLKGASISQYYPNPQYRYSCDMDCILAYKNNNGFESRYEEGNRLLENKGVKVTRDYYKHSEFSVNGLYVENHKFCCSIKRGERTKKLETYLQSLLHPDSAEKVNGLYFPPLMFQAIFMIEHACSHFLYEKISLKHICDWALFRKANIDKLDWVEFKKQCDEFRLWNFVEALSNLADVILGVKTYDDLSALEKRILDDTLQVVKYVDSKKERRFRKALGVLASSWKYKNYGHSSMLCELSTALGAYLFERDPKLG